jgi:hypothetical protein
MSRLAVLRRHPKRTLGGLTVALAAVGVAVGSGATFSSSASDSTSTFTAGKLHASATGDGSAFTATFSAIKPGFGTEDGTGETPLIDAESEGYGSFTVTNDGNLGAAYTLTAAVDSDPYAPAEGVHPTAEELCVTTCLALAGGLKVQVFAGGETTAPLYDGTVAGLDDPDNWTGEATPAWTWTSTDTTKTYDMYFYLPSATDDQYQGGTAKATFTVTGTQN